MNIAAVCVAAIACLVTPITVHAQDSSIALSATAVTLSSQASASIAGLSTSSLLALPGFPAKAYRDGYRDGRVRLGVSVKPDGTVESVEVLDAYPVQVFTRHAIGAVAGWRFAGTGVQERRTVEFRFVAD